MPTSEARVRANQANSLKSTGPSTPAGKLKSRANAVTHGFCAKIVDVEDPQAVRAFAEEIAVPDHDPSFGGWASGQMAVMSVKIERCQESEQATRERIRSRARVTWHDDQKLQATLLGATISKRPEIVQTQLGETLQGCEWMLGRWSMLAHAADVQVSWTPEQTEMAYDLLGTPHGFRDVAPLGTKINVEGRVIERTENQAAVARQQIAILIERREQLRPLDEAARLRAQAGLADETDPEIRLLRRYEASIQRRMEWTYKLLCKLSEPRPGDPEQTSKPESPKPAPPKVKQPIAPSPSRPLSRAERRLIKAESRREARNRKLEKRLI